MPAIPIYTPGAGAVSPTDWYTGLFAPANPPQSFEILHGGMDEVNYTGGAGSITPAFVQIGTMAMAAYSGFRRFEWVYAKGCANDGSTTRGARLANRVVCAGMSLTFELPWDATLVYLVTQAFCRQDATEWDNNGNDPTLARQRRCEFWDFRYYYDVTELTSIYARLPHGRTTTGDSLSTPADLDGTGAPGMHAENRWRWKSRSKLIKDPALLTAGVHELRTSAWPGIFADDITTAKLAMPCGAVGVLALR